MSPKAWLISLPEGRQFSQPTVRMSARPSELMSTRNGSALAGVAATREALRIGADYVTFAEAEGHWKQKHKMIKKYERAGFFTVIVFKTPQNLSIFTNRFKNNSAIIAEVVRTFIYHLAYHMKALSR